MVSCISIHIHLYIYREREKHRESWCTFVLNHHRETHSSLFYADPSYSIILLQINNDVTARGLGVVVLADWHSTLAMSRLKFYDENTHNWWFPETGGSNTVALNKLLKGWGFAFGEGSYSGDYSLEEKSSSFLSGSVLAAAPAGSTIVSALLKDDEADSKSLELLPILGLAQVGTGHVSIYGDSGCVDDASRLPTKQRCYWLLEMLLEYALSGVGPPALLKIANNLESNFSMPFTAPFYPLHSTLFMYSHVLSSRDSFRPLPLCASYRWSSSSTLPSTMLQTVLTWTNKLENRTLSSSLAVSSRQVLSGSLPYHSSVLFISSFNEVLFIIFVVILLIGVVFSTRYRLWRSLLF